MKSSLYQEILHAHALLATSAARIPVACRQLKVMDGTGGKVSVAEVIAYQIGWGKSLIRWYEAGIRGDLPEMPGEGFSSWDYIGIARHFYQKYLDDASVQQMNVLQTVVSQILDMTQQEQQTGNLDREGVWSWCTLPSGKRWPLSKWIRVNTVSPYKRAVQLMKKAKLEDIPDDDLDSSDN